MNHAELAADLLDALDQLALEAVRGRDALLVHYNSWPEDRLLGPPFDLGLMDRPEEMPPLVEEVVRAGLPRRYLQTVIRAHHDHFQLLRTYASGLYAGLSVAGWRHEVERIFQKLATAIDAAMDWIASWPPPALPPSAPSLELLDRHAFLTDELLAQVLGVCRAVAARRRCRGEFGSVTKVGRRALVASSEVKRALSV